MENQIPFGIASSVSANLDFDPLDTLAFARHHRFGSVQINLSEQDLQNASLKKVLQSSNDISHRLFFHSRSRLNNRFLKSRYADQLQRFLEAVGENHFILHFDEQVHVEEACRVVRILSEQGFQIYLENYFESSGHDASEKNLKKYLALFTLLNSGKNVLWPVLDIVRFFDPERCFTQRESLTWCYQLFNYFANRNQPILLHLVDVHDLSQSHKRFCAVMEGQLPYAELFRFLHKNRIPIQSMIFEFEDKLNPLRSRENIHLFWQQLSG